MATDEAVLDKVLKNPKKGWLKKLLIHMLTFDPLKYFFQLEGLGSFKLL
jgi:hypothetical protein